MDALARLALSPDAALARRHAQAQCALVWTRRAQAPAMLPDELLAQIFGHLRDQPAALVPLLRASKKFREMASDDALWSDLEPAQPAPGARLDGGVQDPPRSSDKAPPKGAAPPEALVNEADLGVHYRAFHRRTRRWSPRTQKAFARLVAPTRKVAGTFAWKKQALKSPDHVFAALRINEETFLDALKQQGLLQGALANPVLADCYFQQPRADTAQVLALRAWPVPLLANAARHHPRLLKYEGSCNFFREVRIVAAYMGSHGLLSLLAAASLAANSASIFADPLLPKLFSAMPVAWACDVASFSSGQEPWPHVHHVLSFGLMGRLPPALRHHDRVQLAYASLDAAFVRDHAPERHQDAAFLRQLFAHASQPQQLWPWAARSAALMAQAVGERHVYLDAMDSSLFDSEMVARAFVDSEPKGVPRWRDFARFTPRVRNLRSVAMRVLHRRPQLKHYVDGSLFNDKAFMAQAIEHSGACYQHLGAQLQHDPNLLAAALYSAPEALRFAAPELQGDFWFGKYAVLQNPSLLLWTSPQVRDDDEVAALVRGSPDGRELQKLLSWRAQQALFADSALESEFAG